MRKVKQIIKHNHSGFSLMEMVVVLAIFMIVAVIAVDIYLLMARVQRKTTSMQQVQSDARFAIEAMAREFRNGTVDYDYYRDKIEDSFFPEDIFDYVLITRDQDNNQVFYRKSGSIEDPWDGSGDRLEVCFNDSDDCCYRVDEPLCLDIEDPTWQEVTPSEVKVNHLTFFINPLITAVEDSDPYLLDAGSGTYGSNKQPILTIVIETESRPEGLRGWETEKAKLQTTVSSRRYLR